MRLQQMARLGLVVAIAVAGRSSASPLEVGTTGATPDVLLSRQLVDARGLRIGDLVRLAPEPSGARSGVFRIAGVYEPTPDPMRFAQQSFEARFHLPDLLALTADPSDPGSADTVSSINVALVDPSKADAFARDLSATLPGTVAASTRAPNERTSTFVVIERFHLAVAIITMIGSAVFLLALMMMLVDERRETIGTLRLIGFSRRRILMQVVLEGLCIAAAGTVFGVLFALATEGMFNRFFQWRYDTTLVFVRITPGVVAQSMLLAMPLGVAASAIASWTLLRRHPLALIRR
jgi:putative ABC transport system permease protein